MRKVIQRTLLLPRDNNVVTCLWTHTPLMTNARRINKKLIIVIPISKLTINYKFYNCQLKKNTATFTINRHLACLWSKIGTFQMGIELCKRATMPILRRLFKNTNESFQMRHCMQFFLQGHQNCQNLMIYPSKFT